MKREDQDNDVRRLTEQDSFKTTFISFLMAIIHGAAAAVTCMGGREMIETIGIKVIYSQELEISQYGGLKRIVQISAIVLMVGLWISTFMIVWHKIERAGCLEERVRLGVKWIAGAIVLFAVCAVLQYFVVGYWPTLTGAV